ncbi:hypothetical protein JTB14_026937 [Gonioctena quinquepunctata]|nr:hypothetical protein JTB14_026937 [Gonioctena quinquepunctata]
MDDRTWTIVQFAEDLTVEAISTSWIQGECCHWPPYKQKKLSTSIKKCESLNTNWPRHNIIFFRNATIDDYAKARQKAKTAEASGGHNSESECKGKRKRIQKIISSSSDESFENTEKNNLPPPSELTQLSLKPKTNFADSSLNLSQSRSEGTSMENTVSPRLSETVVCKTVYNIALDKNKNNKEWLDNNENGRTCFLHHENKILVEIKNQNHMLIGIMIDVLEEIREQKNHKIETTSTPIFVKYPDIKFPIGNDEDLKKFEEELQNEENFIEAVRMRQSLFIIEKINKKFS